VLKWIVERLDGQAAAMPSAIGNLPTRKSFDVSGMDLDHRRRQRPLTIDRLRRMGSRGRVLAIGDALAGAVAAHEWLGRAQVGTGHRGKQVVLDLVVQSAEGEVDDPPAADVACREYLAAEVVGLVVGRQDRHSLVVGRE
jgi:hypothetical protein